jgi:hypothetical protein
MLTRRSILTTTALALTPLTGLALSGCGTIMDPSTWGTGTTANKVLAVVAQDAATIASGLEGALPAIGAAAGMSATSVASIGQIIADVQAVSSQLAVAASTSAAQPLVQQLAADVNSIIAALQGVTTLPQQVQLALTAAAVLLPVILTAVELVIPPPPAAAARRSRSSMTPEQARVVLKSVARK